MRLSSNDDLVQIHKSLRREKQVEILQSFCHKVTLRDILGHTISFYIRERSVSPFDSTVAFDGLIKQPAPLPSFTPA